MLSNFRASSLRTTTKIAFATHRCHSVKVARVVFNVTVINHHAAVKHGFDIYERTVVAGHRYNTFDACDVKVKTATKKV